MGELGTQSVDVIVVTNRGRSDDLIACLTALRSDSADTLGRVLVVDNSGDAAGTRDGIARAGVSVGDVAVLAVPNHGYGAAVNRGLAELGLASGADVADTSERLVGVLNDDTVPAAGWLRPLVAVLGSEPAVGVAQPLLLSRDATGQLTTGSRGVELDAWWQGSDIGAGRPIAEAGREPIAIDVFTGGAFVARERFLAELGGFDERYFLYYEDVDLALRGAERGWSYRCVPTSSVVHAGGATTSQHAELTRRLQERNRLLIAARFAPATGLVRAFGLSLRRLRHTPRGLHARALADGVLRAPVRRVERWRRPEMNEYRS